MNTESSFEGGSSFYKSVNELLNKMAMENEHFKLQYLKIDQNPDFTSRFNGETLSENYICGGVQGHQPPPLITPGEYFLLPDVPR